MAVAILFIRIPSNSGMTWAGGTAFLGKFNIKEIKKHQTTVHHLILRELSDAEVDRSGLGPRFNLFDSKTGILEDAPPSA